MARRSAADFATSRESVQKAIAEKKCTQEEFADQAKISASTLSKFLNGTQLGFEAAYKIAVVLKDKTLDPKLLATYLNAFSEPDNTMIRTLLERGGGATINLERSNEAAVVPADITLTMSIDKLAELGVFFDHQGAGIEANTILSYLINPKAPRKQGALITELHKKPTLTSLVTATVVCGHLGHTLMNLGQPGTSRHCFSQTLEWIETLNRERALPNNREKAWEKWQAITQRTSKDFEDWCRQMIAVTYQMRGSRNDIEEGIGQLTYIVQTASRSSSNPDLVIGKTLRDRARARMVLHPTEVANNRMLEREITESISRVSETPDSQMVGMSLLLRSRFSKISKLDAAMERDAVAAMSLLPVFTGVLYPNAINQLAALYSDQEQNLARHFAELALKASTDQHGTYEGQRKQAEALLTRLSG